MRQRQERALVVSDYSFFFATTIFFGAVTKCGQDGKCVCLCVCVCVHAHT
jgi:hypothetical protein